MKRFNFAVMITGIFFLLSMMSGTVLAQGGTQFGVRAGLYSDAEDMFLGGEFLTPISSHVYFNPNIEYVFIDGGNYMTFNADAHYDFDVNSPMYLWAGGGLAVLYVNPDGPVEGETDVGANLLFGIGLQTRGSLVPYIQTKAILSDNNEVAIGFGLRF